MSTEPDRTSDIVSDEPPEWVKSFIIDCCNLLGLQGWEIAVQMVDSIEPRDGRLSSQDMQTSGECVWEEPYRHATIRLVRGYEHDPERQREIVMHELLHLAIAPLHHAAIRALCGLVPERLHGFVEDLLDDGAERTVTPLAKALLRGTKLPAVLQG